jgi:hypothetical protein
MTKLRSLSDEEREILIAFLDGELDAQAARAVEANLNSDPRYRAEADAFNRAWQMLDYLPRPEPKSTFTSRTLERVSTLRPPILAKHALGEGHPWVQAASWAAAVVLAALLGYGGVEFFTSRQESRAGLQVDPADANDLHIVGNQRGPETAHDNDFLRKLDDPELFGEDRPWHEEDSTSQARSRRVLKRYDDWQRQLLESDRQKLLSTASPEDRLRLVKDLRERQWVEQLPQTYQEELKRLQTDPGKYRERITAFRKEEAERRDQWRTAFRHWEVLTRYRPQLAQLVRESGPQIEAFVKSNLLPIATPEERRRLRRAHDALKNQGQWPLFLSTVVELADRYPVRVPPVQHEGARRFADLPAKLQEELKQRPNWPTPFARRAEGSWPWYALGVTRFAVLRKIPLGNYPPLGPTRAADFTPAVQTFIKETLIPALKPFEARQLQAAVGRWPQYARLVMNLAAAHKLAVPGTTLPGPPGLWAAFRTAATGKGEALSAGNRDALPEFIRKELTGEEP